MDGPFGVDMRYPWSLAYGDPGDVFSPTVDEIRSIGEWCQSAGLVSNMTYRDADYAHEIYTSGTIGPFTINDASARAHGLI